MKSPTTPASFEMLVGGKVPSGRRCFLVHPPVRGGVWDFTARLQEGLNTSGEPALNAVMQELSESSPKLAVEPTDVVLLQYSGYGYARRGAPVWLLNEVAGWRERGAVLGIFFHELYATGPPWRSSFWLSPLQRYVASALADLASFWLTNRELSAHWLSRRAADKPHAVLPVFSTVGEGIANSVRRDRKLVVFGSAGTRQGAYRASEDELFSWVTEHEIEVHDIGPPLEDADLVRRLESVSAVIHGRLPPDGVSRNLADAMFGLVACPIDYVAKSSVFAAFAAHGVCAILCSSGYRSVDGLVQGKHYLPGFLEGALAADYRAVGAALWEWYQPHRFASHTKMHKTILSEVGFRAG